MDGKNPAQDMGARERLLEAALELFAKRGFDGTGIQEIVDTAGVTKPTLYYYFGNKHGLLEGILAEYGETLAALVRRNTAYHHDLVMNLTGLLTETVVFARKNPPFWRLFRNLASAAPESPSFAPGSDLRKTLLVCLEALFKAASKDHGNMKGREKLYGETFFGLLESCSILVLNGELALNDHERYRIIHQYMHGIFS
jgi:TetR/AcrR family transcriptional regulator